MSMFVKIDPNHFYNMINVKYNNCVMEVESSVGYSHNVKDAKTGEIFPISKDECVLADEPEDILDQPCYKDCTDVAEGDFFLDEDEDVWKVLKIDGSVVRAIDASSDGGRKWIRSDELTKMKKLDPNGDEVVDHDYVTEEPIFTYNEESTYSIHGFDRYGGAKHLGQILPCTATENEDVVRCYDCDDYFYRGDPNFDDYMHTTGDIWVCESCFENNWVLCECCGEMVRTEDAYYSDDNDCYYCESCYENHRVEQFHDYSYKPEPCFHNTDDTTTYHRETPYLGVELEIDCGDKRKAVEELYDIGDNEDLFYMKHDGSLGGPGIEIVTHPCELDYHLEKFPWDEISETAVRNGYKSHNTSTCGLHVHMSRSAFGTNEDLQDLNIAKIIILVDRFWDELVKFSRRDYEALRHWAKKPDAKIYSYDNETTAITKAKNSGNRDRYKAVNLTNTNTVEFRLFRGTLKVSTIKATLQLLMNMLNFAKSTALADIQDAKWKQMSQYEEYPELMAYLTEKDLVDVPDKPKPVEPKPIKARFNPNDVVWFDTENTNHEATRGIVQNVYRDENYELEPLYVVFDEADRVHFLIDSEIYDTEDINRREVILAEDAAGEPVTM